MRFLIALIVVIAAFAGESRAAGAPEPVEFQTGETKIKGLLFRPEGAGPFPAIVALHGCTGLHNASGAVSNIYRDWGQRLVAQGFAVLWPDSYGSRGLGNQCNTRARAVRVNRERIADANAARLWLAEQAWTARDRISLMGWSTGAITALWTVRPQVAGKAEPNDFRSAVAFYPGCRRLMNTAWSARIPTLILVGSADETTSASVCQQMVAGARGRSARALVHVYPGAHHDFDHPNRPLQVRSGYAFALDGSGRIHSGTNAAARADALKRVPEWLKR
jgi:dienelactone hydrolase